MDLWVVPEIERRRASGVINGEFVLSQVQVVFPSPLDDRHNVVRLNDEVKAQARVKVNREVAQGELVYESDVAEMDIILMADEDEPNSGHLTMIRIGQSWHIGFDFRRDKKRSQDYLQRAQEFLTAARLCFRRRLTAAGVDNLYSAAELAAKAELLLFIAYLPGNARTLKDHGFVRGRYGRWTGLGNAPKDANSALTKLSGLRPKARYVEGELETVETGRLLRAVGKMIKHTQRRLAAIETSSPPAEKATTVRAPVQGV
jgi:hypothetical protein